MRLSNPIPKSLIVSFLLIIPLFFFLSGICYQHSTGIYFLKTVDPEYAYLFSGAVMADLKPDIYYVDHPGTPLVVIIAVVMRVVHAFRGGEDMLTDFMKNPELYLRAALYTIEVLSATVIFLLGLFVYKKTRNIILALFLQLIPFAHYLALETQARLIPESMMVIVISFWVMLIIRMNQDKETGIHPKWYGIAFGILFGFSLALKLTLLPLVLIPLIVLSGLKSRLWFSATAVISFFVFAFPILFKYHTFYMWVKNIITHTGAYGSGDKGIVHWNEFIEHLRQQIANTPYLLISFLFLAIVLVIYFAVRKQGTRRDPLKASLAVAAILVTVFQYLITAKHFAFHYMLPSILLTLPMVVLAGSILVKLFPALFEPLRLNAIIGLLGIYLLVHIIPTVNQYLSLREARRKTQEESYMKFIENRPQGPLIVSASYYGCSAVEYALTFGIQECGNYSPYMLEKMNKVYPSTYLYYPWAKTFYAGRSGILPSSFLKAGTDYMLYIADYSNEKLDEITGLLNQTDKNMHWNAKKIYLMESTNEALFHLQAASQ
jgi:hypothetical protein